MKMMHLPFSRDFGQTTITVSRNFSVSALRISILATNSGVKKSSKSDVSRLMVFFRCSVDKTRVFSLQFTLSFFNSSSTFVDRACICCTSSVKGRPECWYRAKSQSNLRKYASTLNELILRFSDPGLETSRYCRSTFRTTF